MHRLEHQLCDAVRKLCHGRKHRVPEAARAFIEAFGNLSVTRSWHPNGPNPISFAEIESWSRLMRVPLQPNHVALLRAMDAVWIEEFHKKRQGAPEGQKTLPPMSQHPINAGLLDAMLG